MSTLKGLDSCILNVVSKLSLFIFLIRKSFFIECFNLTIQWQQVSRIGLKSGLFQFDCVETVSFLSLGRKVSGWSSIPVTWHINLGWCFFAAVLEKHSFGWYVKLKACLLFLVDINDSRHESKVMPCWNWNLMKSVPFFKDFYFSLCI